jgi:hypothetical protein
VVVSSAVPVMARQAAVSAATGAAVSVSRQVGTSSFNTNLHTESVQVRAVGDTTASQVALLAGTEAALVLQVASSTQAVAVI